MWVLALAAVVALSAGEAAAQATSVTVSAGTLEVEEGGTASFNVSLNRAPTATATAPAVAQGVVTVTITIASDNNGAAFTYTLDGQVTDLSSNNTIEFPAGVTPAIHQLAILSAEDTNATDGRVVLSVTATTAGSGAPAVAPKTVFVNEDDNDETRVNVAPRSLTIQEGGMGNYSIVLGSEPSNDVTISIRTTNRNAAVSARFVRDNGTPGNAADDGSHTSIVFVNDDEGTVVDENSGGTPGNRVRWNAPQTITVMAGADVDTISGSATISHSISTVDANYAGISAPSVTVKEIDSVRTVTLATSTDSVMEGDSVNISATLGHPDADYTGSLALSENVTVQLSLDRNPAAAGSYTLSSGGKITIMAGQVTGLITLDARHDGDDNDESLSFSATLGGSTTVVLGTSQKVKMAIEDDDTYELTAGKAEVNEGDEVTLTVEVDPKAALDTDVRIELYRASGATVEPGPGDVPDYVTIMEGETEAEFTLKTARDADSEDETIVARAKVGGAIVGEDLMVTVLDGLTYTISLEPDAIGEADGEASVTLTVETNKAISSTKDTMVKFAVEPDSTAMNPDDYTIMPESGMIEVMIEKGMTKGMTTVMVTPVADGMDEPNETIKLSGWVDDKLVGNYVHLMLIDGDSMTYTLSGPSDMNLVEGFEYDIEVTASSPVMADTTVMIMHGEGSTATAEDDYMIEDIMIMAGETMGRTKLMVKSDDMPDGGTDGGMAEKLMLYGMVGNMRTNDLSFYIWDLAVPALPVIAQLLLGALMAIGGYRRYRRR